VHQRKVAIGYRNRQLLLQHGIDCDLVPAIGRRPGVPVLDLEQRGFVARFRQRLELVDFGGGRRFIWGAATRSWLADSSTQVVYGSTFEPICPTEPVDGSARSASAVPREPKVSAMTISRISVERR